MCGRVEARGPSPAGRKVYTTNTSLSAKRIGTWEEVSESEMPIGQKVLYGKLVFKLNRKVDGKITLFKARWMVKTSALRN